MEMVGIVLGYLLALFFIFLGIIPIICPDVLESVWDYLLVPFYIIIGLFLIYFIPIKGEITNKPIGSYLNGYFFINENYAEGGFTITDRDTLKAYKEYDIRFVDSYKNGRLWVNIDQKFNILGKNIFTFYTLKY